LEESHLELLLAIAGVASVALHKTERVESLHAENRRLLAEIVKHDMIGESSAMRAVLQFVAKAAPLESTVLITGESGTGKELVARAIHDNSRRSHKPFAAINCAALSESLLESELFGYERGAFTGAVAQKKGRLEAAAGGTIFFDEIGELTLSLQPKLLRVLQQHEFERVGGTRTVRTDLRFVAARNRDLKKAVAAGTFREDLYYRLNVLTLETPPLRHRREDIPLLVNYFAATHSARCGRHLDGISPEARACLAGYDWPGNVRELENAIERAVALGSANVLLPEDLPEAILDGVRTRDAVPGFHSAVKDAKRRLIIDALQGSNGNRTEAAVALGLNPTYLHRLIRTLNIDGA
jgi:transcriptional regulator with GAF, ATPase, and Fis domain